MGKIEAMRREKTSEKRKDSGKRIGQSSEGNEVGVVKRDGMKYTKVWSEERNVMGR